MLEDSSSTMTAESYFVAQVFHRLLSTSHDHLRDQTSSRLVSDISHPASSGASPGTDGVYIERLVMQIVKI